jgi:hypothetical protein
VDGTDGSGDDSGLGIGYIVGRWNPAGCSRREWKHLDKRRQRSYVDGTNGGWIEGVVVYRLVGGRHPGGRRGKWYLSLQEYKQRCLMGCVDGGRVPVLDKHRIVHGWNQVDGRSRHLRKRVDKC